MLGDTPTENSRTLLSQHALLVTGSHLIVGGQADWQWLPAL